MKRAVLRVLMAVVILAVLCATQIVNAADKPKIPLQLGIYVPEGVECPKLGSMNPKDYAFTKYPQGSIMFGGDGFGCNDGNMFDYHFTNVKSNGSVYQVKGETTGGGGHNMGSFDLTLTIDSKTSFSINKAEGVAPLPLINKKKKVYRYRYCGNPDNIKYPRQ